MSIPKTSVDSILEQLVRFGACSAMEFGYNNLPIMDIDEAKQELKKLIEGKKKTHGVCMCDCIECHFGNHSKCQLGDYPPHKKNELCNEKSCCDETWEKAIEEIRELFK